MNQNRQSFAQVVQTANIDLKPGNLDATEVIADAPPAIRPPPNPARLPIPTDSIAPTACGCEGHEAEEELNIDGL